MKKKDEDVVQDEGKDDVGKDSGKTYEDVEEDDLFWLTNSPNSAVNHAYRKIDETRGANTRNGTITENIGKRTIVYQKT